jgi:hypothetical protein
MPRIGWVADADAAGQLAEEIAWIRVVSAGSIPDIVRTMRLRPDIQPRCRQPCACTLGDGALTRAQHEMIASYVSVLTCCRY